MTASEFEIELKKDISRLNKHAFKYFKDDKANRDDLVQDTLINAFKSLESFDGRYFFAWMCMIMKNKFIDYTRRNKNRIIDIDEVNSDIVSTEIDFFDKDIQMDVKMLPPRYREPLMLFIDGYEYEEIATILKMPRNSVGSNIFHGRDLLKGKRQMRDEQFHKKSDLVTNDIAFNLKIAAIKKISIAIDGKL